MKNFGILKKIIIAGFPAGIFLIFINALTTNAGLTIYISKMTFNIKEWILSIACYYIMIGMILVLVYDAIKTGLKGDNPLTKGLLFGILVWMIQTLPNVIHPILQDPTLIEFIKIEFITGFVSYPLVGVLIALIYNRYIEV